MMDDSKTKSLIIIIVSVSVIVLAGLLIYGLIGRKANASGAVGTVSSQDCIRINGTVEVVGAVQECHAGTAILKIVD